ncbi:MAG: Mur ligase [Gammaproteobacteria bacterium]|nr:Mur ligase [Gammaproteobacteria bacterium]
MELLDCRRLTGPNVVWDKPGAVIDIACDDAEAGDAIAGLADILEPLLAALGWRNESLAARKCIGGFSLALSAPMDALYAATEILEAAWNLHGDCDDSLEDKLVGVRSAIAEESKAALTELLRQADRHQTAWLLDDDVVSLGLGRHAKSWPVRALPGTAALRWESFNSIPVGLITGTNGKTTTSRLVANMVAAGGRISGLTSTDWMAVGGAIIDEGDYAGPGGARTVLRDQRVDVAVLETARGGLLRRGLAVRRADAALITNISEDHLGDFGSRSLEELLEIKWTVTRALSGDKPLILNADDAMLVARAQNTDARIVFFSPDADNKILAQHLSAGGDACSVVDGALARGANGEWHAIMPAEEPPITFSGAARHNIANALGAIAMAHALGVPDEAIARGLRQTQRGDNPGRCNLYEVDGIKVLVDFAHNVDAMRALFQLARKLPAKRRLLCFGQAGDRPDASIAELAQSAWQIGLDLVVISELEKYYRGREPNEVYAIMAKALREAGADASQIAHSEDEMAALRLALQEARPGDLVIMLALAASTEIRAWLKDKEQHDAG